MPGIANQFLGQTKSLSARSDESLANALAGNDVVLDINNMSMFTGQSSAGPKYIIRRSFLHSTFWPASIPTDAAVSCVSLRLFRYHKILQAFPTDRFTYYLGIRKRPLGTADSPKPYIPGTDAGIVPAWWYGPTEDDLCPTIWFPIDGKPVGSVWRDDNNVDILYFPLPVHMWPEAYQPGGDPTIGDAIYELLGMILMKTTQTDPWPTLPWEVHFLKRGIGVSSEYPALIVEYQTKNAASLGQLMLPNQFLVPSRWDGAGEEYGLPTVSVPGNFAVTAFGELSDVLPPPVTTLGILTWQDLLTVNAVAILTDEFEGMDHTTYDILVVLAVAEATDASGSLLPSCIASGDLDVFAFAEAREPVQPGQMFSQESLVMEAYGVLSDPISLLEGIRQGEITFVPVLTLTRAAINIEEDIVVEVRMTAELIDLLVRLEFSCYTGAEMTCELEISRIKNLRAAFHVVFYAEEVIINV